MATHTPGPWRVASQTLVICDSASIAYAAADRVQIFSKGAPAGEAEANARLIAAAPDLLQACRDALMELRFQGHQLGAKFPDVASVRFYVRIAALERAILNAEGGTA